MSGERALRHNMPPVPTEPDGTDPGLDLARSCRAIRPGRVPVEIRDGHPGVARSTTRHGCLTMSDVDQLIERISARVAVLHGSAAGVASGCTCYLCRVARRYLADHAEDILILCPWCGDWEDIDEVEDQLAARAGMNPADFGLNTDQARTHTDCGVVKALHRDGFEGAVMLLADSDDTERLEIIKKSLGKAAKRL